MRKKDLFSGKGRRGGRGGGETEKPNLTLQSIVPVCSFIKDICMRGGGGRYGGGGEG